MGVSNLSALQARSNALDMVGACSCDMSGVVVRPAEAHNRFWRRNNEGRAFLRMALSPQNHCFEQVALTIPFYSATAYALGALIARNLPRSSATKLDDTVPQTAR